VDSRRHLIEAGHLGRAENAVTEWRASDFACLFKTLLDLGRRLMPDRWTPAGHDEESD
jgi:hypothetical protein